MEDINDIKGNVLVSFVSEWFFLWLSVVIILWVISYIIYINKDKIFKKEERQIVKLERKPFYDKIKGISIDDNDFFEIISHLVRFYLSERWIIAGAINKTNKEIGDFIIDNKNYLLYVLKLNADDFNLLNEFLEKCAKFQFMDIQRSDDEKIKLKTHAKQIIKNY